MTRQDLRTQFSRVAYKRCRQNSRKQQRDNAGVYQRRKQLLRRCHAFCTVRFTRGFCSKIYCIQSPALLRIVHILLSFRKHSHTISSVCVSVSAFLRIYVNRYLARMLQFRNIIHLSVCCFIFIVWLAVMRFNSRVLLRNISINFLSCTHVWTIAQFGKACSTKSFPFQMAFHFAVINFWRRNAKQFIILNCVHYYIVAGIAISTLSTPLSAEYNSIVPLTLLLLFEEIAA